ncbi:reverse transcriptase domain-containing protein [Tanacetum coccineum]
MIPERRLNEEVLKNEKELAEEEVLINPAFPEQKVTIGIQFSPACRLQLINLLKDNKDVFAWQPSDMIGVPRRIIQHSLNVNLSITPVAQKRRVLGPEKSKAVMKKVEDGLSTIGSELRGICGQHGHQKQDGTGDDNGHSINLRQPSEGIRANPKKTKAVADMQSLNTLKEMQSLSGKLAALNRFLSRFAERALPFFKTLKNITKENKDDYRWTVDAERAFQEMKKLIIELPTLTTLGLKETLYVYLAASKDAVITDQPIKQILNKLKVSGKLAKYMVELGAYNITYVPRNAIKGQVLADFLNEVPSIKLERSSTNNEAEYEALLAGLRIVEKMKVRALKATVDSKLVACQLNGEFDSSNEGMTKYLTKAKEHVALFKRGVWNACGARSIAAKIMRQGYYWPSMHRDTKEMVDNCHSCQIHASVPRLLKTHLTSIMSLWPFHHWGLDILGPLTEGLDKLKFIIVAIDYFTNWMEAKPLAKTTGKEAQKFVWENIACIFGLPRVIVTDNETQLVNDPFKSWCKK